MSGVCARGQVEERERDGGGGVDCLRRVGSASLAFTLPHRRSHRRLDRSEVMKPQDMRREITRPARLTVLPLCTDGLTTGYFFGIGVVWVGGQPVDFAPLSTQHSV